MPKKILIVSHKFPPSPGIGGRRWAKFAKYLSSNGNEVYILAAENAEKGISPWMKDVENLSVERLPFRYPKILVNPVKNNLDKIIYRLTVSALKYLDKGNYYDRSIFWERQISERVSWYIESKKVDTIIVTGGPFRIVYFVTKLKLKYPNVIFVSDFRDYWTEDLEISALSHLSEKRRATERKLELDAVNHSDLVFTVSEHMRRFFDNLSQKNNCVLIPNGYDPDDLIKPITIGNMIPAQNEKIRLVFAGTMYSNLDYILAPFFHALKKIKTGNPELYKYIQLEFYGKFPSAYRKHINDNNVWEAVSVLGERPYPEVSQKLQEAHFGVLFLNDSYNFSFSTKFCEYVALKKKILVISRAGDTADFVVKNRLGFHIDPGYADQALTEIFSEVVNHGFEVESNWHFDETIFSVAKISGDLEIAINNFQKFNLV